MPEENKYDLADEIAKASKAGDKVKVNQLIREQAVFQRTHAQAMGGMKHYTDLYTEGSRQRSRLGKSGK